MTAKSICPTRTLADTPAVIDQFGSHERIAQVLAELVESNDGGKCLGIEGTWGSGKSTVVTILEKKLSRNLNQSVLLFDAWAHQGDPLRRVFLERLILHLKAHDWIEGKNWDDKLAELAKRKKYSDITTDPRVTPALALVALSLLLIPLAGILLSAGLAEHGHRWEVVCGLILFSAPFVIFLLAVIWYGVRQLLSKQPFNIGAVLWSIFVAKTSLDVHTDILESAEPTSIEFQEAFDSVLRSGLSDNKKRLAIVIDNLDRIDAHSASEVWSTLQTFLRKPEHQQEDWFKQLWVIVTYDPNSIDKLLKETQISDSDSAIFLDKVFQLRFSVPVPVLSNWRTFLFSLLEEAFPRHAEQDFTEFHRIYRLARNLKTNVPLNSPRDLKVFVNQIGSIHRQWQGSEEIPLPHIAYYVLLTLSRMKSIGDELRSGAIPTARDSEQMGPSIKDDIAQMLFNVDREPARQLLLLEPTQAALADGDIDRFMEIMDYPGGLSVVIDETLSGMAEGWSGEEISELANAAQCVHRSDLLGRVDPGVSASIKATFRKGGMSVKEWWPLSNEVADGVLALCALLPDGEFQRTFFQTVSISPVVRPAEGAEKERQITNWLDAILKILDGLDSLGQSEYIVPVKIRDDPDVYVNISDLLLHRGNDSGRWHLIQPEDPSAVLEKLVQAVGSGFEDQHLNTVHILSSTQLVEDWQSVLEAMIAKIAPSSSLAPAEVGRLMSALWMAPPDGAPFDSGLAAIAENGRLLECFHEAMTARALDTAALCMVAFLNYVPSGRCPSAISSAGQQLLIEQLHSPEGALVDEFVRVLSESQRAPLLLRVLNAAEESPPFIGNCIRRFVNRGMTTEIGSPEEIMTEWQRLDDALGTEEPINFETLLNAYIEQTDLADRAAGRSFQVEDASLYLRLIKAGAASSASFASWCKSGLDSVTEEKWEEGLRQGSEIVLFLGSATVLLEVSLGISFADAMRSVAKDVLDGINLPSNIRTIWPGLVNALGVGAMREHFRRGVLDDAIAHEGNFHSLFFDLYGPELEDLQILTGNIAVVSRLFRILLELRHWEGLQWILELLTKFPQIWRGRRFSNEIAVFRERVEAELGKPEDEKTEIIKSIYSALPTARRRQGS